ncbi:hypothetical protein HPB50_001301 [Hyalomma asiaticum]|uniref:Uncharacterized protein n=1 Tax=Hyalomma asiaticum TaxID=266040 RepID=A0ACB7SB87_HYAAI|nr:hypothetical protein HPB50_001301 [Hyalomma asiaticum]
MAPIGDPCEIPAHSPMLIAMATCHTLTSVDRELVGDPLDLTMFRSTRWVMEEPATDGIQYDVLTPTVMKPRADVENTDHLEELLQLSSADSSFKPGYALSGTSNRSRAYDLLLKEAGEFIRRDANKLPLSPRRRTRRTKRKTPDRHRKQDLTAKAASAPTESLLNTESFLAKFVLPDPPLPPAGEAKEAAAANVSTTTTTRDSPDPPLPPPEEAEEAAMAILTAPAPTTRDSPPPVPRITAS